MQKSVCKLSCCRVWIFSVVLALFAGLIGCGDNPDSKAAREVRTQTESAIQASLAEKDYHNSRDKVVKALVQKRTAGLTKDSALLASGNLGFAQAQQMQADLSLKRLPLRGSVDEFEKLFRATEGLFVEKNKLEMLLSVGDREIVELTALINGINQKPGLTSQLRRLEKKKRELLSRKSGLEQQQSQLQRALDNQQSQADGFLRQAELEAGDRRLSLEQQAFELLKLRKDQYVQLQAVENQIEILNNNFDLLQSRISGIETDIQDAQGRIKEVESSTTRMALKGQIQEVENSIGEHKQKLMKIASEVNEGYRTYLDLAEQVCGVFKEAMSEFEKVSRGAGYTGVFGQAESAHQAALACQQQIRMQKYLAERLDSLTDVTDSDDSETSAFAAFVSSIKGNLRIPTDIPTDLKTDVFALFDKSVEAYKEAESAAGRLGSEVRCSIAKSKLLALYSKMKLADYLSEYDLANQTETELDQIIQESTELGDCFTQSEALQIVQSQGLNYMPAIPLNMQVFAEGKKQELSMWKQLPVSEQEAAVDKNLLIIDELIQQHGQDFGQQLESIKQEMLTAKKGGFKETASSGFGDPNSIF